MVKIIHKEGRSFRIEGKGFLKGAHPFLNGENNFKKIGKIMKPEGRSFKNRKNR